MWLAQSRGVHDDSAPHFKASANSHTHSHRALKRHKCRAPTRVEPPTPPAEPLSDHYKLLPTSLRVLWTIWLSAVCVNLVVWLMVSISGGELAYFWPMWVAGPAGAALLGVSIGVTGVRRGRREAALRRRR